MARVQDFVNNILGEGLSYNNEYTFSFQSNGSQEEGTAYYRLAEYARFKDIFINPDNSSYLKVSKSAGDKLRVLCEEINLPGVSSATGQARGINQGVDFKYAHTKIYNDLNITFICDKDLTPLRFFQIWHSWIYAGDNNPDASGRSYVTKLYNDYCLNMYIQKIETKYKDNFQTAYYKLINAFPISVSSIPLNSGASSITRVSVTLAYERWIFKNPAGLLPSDWTE